LVLFLPVQFLGVQDGHSSDQVQVVASQVTYGRDPALITSRHCFPAQRAWVVIDAVLVLFGRLVHTPAPGQADQLAQLFTAQSITQHAELHPVRVSLDGPVH